MRRGGERRVRHDVSAKAKNPIESQAARDIVDHHFLQAEATTLIQRIAAISSTPVSDEVLSAAAHELIRQALLRHTASRKERR